MTIYDKTTDEKILFPVGIGILQTETTRNFYNTSDATANPDDIVSGKTSYGKYGMINGTLDLEAEKNASYQEGYTNGEFDGYADGYEAGIIDGIEDGREEIIQEQSDANITPDKVSEGFIGYGPNNERIVGTNVGGFNYSAIGYSDEQSQEVNIMFADDIIYVTELYNSWNPLTTSASRLYLNKKFLCAPYINTTNVTRTDSMFNGCTSLKFVPLFDTTNVTNMSAMFSGCSSLITVPKFDTTNVTTLESMFNGCSSLTDVPLFDTTNVTNISRMFFGCSSLTDVPLFDTTNVTSTMYMFENCSSLITVPKFDTTNVTTMYDMFYQANNIVSLPEFEAGKVTNIGYFCTSPKLTDFGGLKELGKTANLNTQTAFSYCSNLTRESMLNIFNNLYDRASAGYSTITLKFHLDVLNILSADDIAIATNKGWIIS